ncbi:MAG TPA: PilT/PilU family type 4a pilus ATPase [Candidatus Tumulicola sp.]|nr:PilT/PilU family type 4a pilus ATPase [Candidatus Tumulicola sp.]
MNAALLPAVRFFDALEAARERGGSDVHVSAGLPPVLRVDGSLERLPEEPFSAEDVCAIVTELFRDDQFARLKAKGDHTTARCDARFGTLRVHAYAGMGGWTIAVRLLDREIPSLEALRLPQAMHSLAGRERGLVIIAGPTGSGKSTTLAALVDRINDTSGRRIVTIEDPIEYRHESRQSVVTQRELGRDTPELGVALRGALRADPDVIVVGEMRDAESMAGALTAAETGHLVMTTLHTGNAAQTVERIVDSFSGSQQTQVRTQLAQVLAAVACQRLVPRARGIGRCAIVELLFGTDAVRNLIRESKAHQLKNVMATGKRFGMQTFEQHVAELVRDRELDPAEAVRLGFADAGKTVA